MRDRVLEIAKVLLGEMDIDRVLTSALDGVIELCGAERGMILLFDPEGGIRFEAARNLDRRHVANPEFEISRTVIEEVRKGGSPFFSANLPAQSSSSLGDSVFRLGLMAVICLPMRHGDDVFGVVYLDNRNPRHGFTEETVELVASFSQVISAAAFNAVDRSHLRERVDSLERELREQYSFEGIVGRDPKMLEVLRLIARVATSEATILIEGESGTGKELVARAVHFNSGRKEGPFLPINCGALPETLQEAELFGHERGAFTGAVRDSLGWFERANHGTLFLDEVGEMPLQLQVKFLRVLETGDYSRLGSTTIRCADARIVAATNGNLEQLVEAGVVRPDLNYRLNVIKVTLPALRERRSDVPVLVRHFLDKLGGPDLEDPWRLTPAAEAALLAYNFPGNVRELQNILQRAVLLTRGPEIDLSDLPPELGQRPGVVPVQGSDNLGRFKHEKQRVVEGFERSYIERRLEESEGNISSAARAAGIDVKNFHTKMTRYGIDPAVYKKARAPRP